MLPLVLGLVGAGLVLFGTSGDRPATPPTGDAAGGKPATKSRGRKLSPQESFLEGKKAGRAEFELELAKSKPAPAAPAAPLPDPPKPAAPLTPPADPPPTPPVTP